MVKIEVRCPQCSEIGHIDVEEDIVKSEKRGLLAVNVAEDMVCQHSFIAYVDKNLNVRNYFTADFMVQIAELPQEEKPKGVEVPSQEELDVELIKLNLSVPLLTFMLHAMFFKKKILLVSDEFHMFSHYEKFFDYITQNNFDIDISFAKKSTYKISRARFAEHVTFIKLDQGSTLKYKYKFMIPDIENPKKMNEMKNIVMKFQHDPDHTSSLILLKNDLKRIYDMCERIIEFLDDREVKNVNFTDLAAYLKGIYERDFSRQFVQFLINILNYYFELELTLK